MQKYVILVFGCVILVQKEGEKIYQVLDFVWVGYRICRTRVWVSLCRRGDLNPHALSGTTPSRWRVYQFHHFGMQER